VWLVLLTVNQHRQVWSKEQEHALTAAVAKFQAQPSMALQKKARLPWGQVIATSEILVHMKITAAQARSKFKTMMKK
jgi:hypothetical protein